MNYAVYEYAYNTITEQYTDIRGQVKAFVVADDAFEACEKAGLTDASRYFAEPVYDEELKKIKADIKEEKTLLGKLEEQIDGFIGEAVKKSKSCPNCEKELNDKYECPACGYGVDEVAIGGCVVTKEMMDELGKKATKKAIKKGELTHSQAKKLKRGKPRVCGGGLIKVK